MKSQDLSIYRRPLACEMVAKAPGILWHSPDWRESFTVAKSPCLIASKYLTRNPEDCDCLGPTSAYDAGKLLLWVTLGMTPEEKAREQIDAQLTASGWVVQTKDKINLSASLGVAVCELSFATGDPITPCSSMAKPLAR